jgi:anthranilate phosphoribosyltransferase
MSAPRELLQQLLERRDLSAAQAEALLAQLTDPQTPPAMAGALLAALSTKGVVAQELLGLAQPARHRHCRHRRGCLREFQHLHRHGAADRRLRCAGHQAR